MNTVTVEQTTWITTIIGLLYLAIVLPFTFYVVFKVDSVLGWNQAGGLLFLFGLGMCTTLVIEGLVGNLKDIFREYKEVRRE